jgi:hypothetical protein
MSQYRIQERKDGNYIQVRKASPYLWVRDYIDVWSYVFSYVMWVGIYNPNDCSLDNLNKYINEMEEAVRKDREEVKDMFTGKNVIKTTYVEPKIKNKD